MTQAAPPPTAVEPDPGTPRSRRVAVIGTIILVLAVTLMQQLGGSSATQQQAPGVAAAPVDQDQFTITAKCFVKIGRAMGPGAPVQPFTDALKDMATTPQKQARLAVVEGELAGREAALARLDLVEKDLAPDAAERPSLAALRAVYTTGSDALTDDDRAMLARDHGWFGRLAATFGRADSDAERADLVGGGAALIALFMVFGLGVLLALVAGFGLFITGIVLAATGKLRRRFVAPAPGGSVALEMLTAFIAAFVLLKLAAEGVAATAGDTAAVWFSLVAQWLLVGVIAWPVARGVPWERARRMLGWHSGRGVFVEIGCGVLGYLASLPLLIAGAVATIVILSVQQYFAGKQPPPENHVADLVARSAGSFVIVLLVALATLWAPLVEETVFRGGLYRHLRGYWHWAAAGLVSAVLFAMMHAYGLALLPPLVGLGFGFAMIREWRGSLIACMTAHFLHNAAVMAFVLTTIKLVGV